MSRRVALYLGAGVDLALTTLAVVFQLQHVVCSTARLENESSYLLSDVIIRVGEAIVPVEDISPGGSKFVGLPMRGEATFAVEFSAVGEKHKDCSEYVEGGMYSVRVAVTPVLAVSCRGEPGIFSRGMLVELL